MKKNIPERQQQCRPAVLIALLAVPSLLVIGLLVFRSGSKPAIHAETVAAVPVANAGPIMVPEIVSPAASVVENDDMAPETREALEAAGLHGVRLTSLALSVKARPPVIVGSAVGSLKPR